MKETLAHGTERRKTKREGMMVAILVVLAGGGKEVKEPRLSTCCLLEKAIHAVE